MKKLLILLASVLLIVGCNTGSNKELEDGSTLIFNDLYGKVVDVKLTNGHGSLYTDKDEVSVMVVTVKFENKGEKGESIGGSYVELVVDGDEENSIRPELMSGSDDAFRLHEELEPEASKTAEFIFGVSTAITEHEVNLKFNDILYTKSGTLKVDLEGVERVLAKDEVKSNSNNNVESTGDYKHTQTLGDYTVSINDPVVMNDEEMKAEYPEMVGLNRGYTWLLIDAEIINSSDETIPNWKLGFFIEDNFGESTTMTSVYAKRMGGAGMDYEEYVAGEAHTGLMVFAIRDDVTSVKLTTKKIQDTYEGFNFEFDLD